MASITSTQEPLLPATSPHPPQDGLPLSESLTHQLHKTSAFQLRFAACRQEVRKQYQIAGPMMITCLLQTLFPIVSLMFVGHVGSLQLAGASLANSFSVVTGLTLMLGLGSGLETLCGQAYGAQQYRALGIYLQAAIFVLLILAVPLAIVWFNMEAIFVGLGQDSKISAVAGQYFRWLVPSLFANAILQPLLKFLQTQSLVVPATVCSLLASAIHVLLCYILVYKTSMGFTGGALAVSITYWLNAIFILIYLYVSSACVKTWEGFSSEAFSAVIPFLKLAIPSAVMICLEYWSFEILVLLSGLLPNPELETSLLAVCVNTEAVQFMLPFGLSAAASTRVANELGAGNAPATKFSVRVSVWIATIQSLAIAIFFLLIRHLWGWAFSSDVIVVHEVARMMPLLAVSIFLDGIQGVLSGVARGCGWQHLGVFVNLGAFYGFGMPMGLVLAFVLKLNSKGLWGGLSSGLFLQTCILLVITLKTNWDNMVELARNRVHLF